MSRHLKTNRDQAYAMPCYLKTNRGNAHAMPCDLKTNREQANEIPPLPKSFETSYSLPTTCKTVSITTRLPRLETTPFSLFSMATGDAYD